MQDYSDNRLKRSPEGEEHGQSLLTEAEVIEMRILRKELGLPYSWIAYDYDIHEATAYFACTGITWKCCPEPPAPKVGQGRNVIKTPQQQFAYRLLATARTTLAGGSE